MNLALFFIFGIVISCYRTENVDTTGLEYNLSSEVEGVIKNIKPTTYGIQIILENVYFHSDKRCFPSNVRINLTQDSEHLMIGDIIRANANLSPPMHEVIPGGFDFHRQAFFNNIGAIGNGDDVSILFDKYDSVVNMCMNNNVSTNFMQNIHISIQNMRRFIYNKLVYTLGTDNGAFAAAILIGETGGISKNVLNNMRQAGISHILCVSGLHLSLVAMLVFIGMRVILNLFDCIAFSYDIKKISAIIAVFASTMYLFLSGAQIAASRAFIMVAIGIFAIIIGRMTYPIRSLLISAFLLLLFHPEYAIHPSFQLSYIAVFSLIVGYNISTHKTPMQLKIVDPPLTSEHDAKITIYTVLRGIIYLLRKVSNIGVFRMIRTYVASNIYSSLIASIATAPIVIYHFYTFANYSVLANLVAIPVMSFMIMPFAILGVILINFEIAKYPLYIVSYGIDIIKDSAARIVELPYALWHVGHINAIGVTIIYLGIFWYAFLSTKLRYYGILVCIIGIGIAFNNPHVNCIVNFEKQIIAIQEGVDSSKLKIYSNRSSNFLREYWTNWVGQDKVLYKKVKSFNSMVFHSHTKNDNITENYRICVGRHAAQCDITVDFFKHTICTCDNECIDMSAPEYMNHNTIIGTCRDGSCEILMQKSARFKFKKSFAPSSHY